MSEAKMDRVGGIRAIKVPPPDAISLALACVDLPALGEVKVAVLADEFMVVARAAC